MTTNWIDSKYFLLPARESTFFKETSSSLSASPAQMERELTIEKSCVGVLTKYSSCHGNTSQSFFSDKLVSGNLPFHHWFSEYKGNGKQLSCWVSKETVASMVWPQMKGIPLVRELDKIPLLCGLKQLYKCFFMWFSTSTTYTANNML